MENTVIQLHTSLKFDHSHKTPDLVKNTAVAALRITGLNKPNVFSYICGEHTLQRNRKHINDLVKLAYLAYFKVMLGDQGKSWEPHIACKLFAYRKFMPVDKHR